MKRSNARLNANRVNEIERFTFLTKRFTKSFRRRRLISGRSVKPAERSHKHSYTFWTTIS